MQGKLALKGNIVFYSSELCKYEKRECYDLETDSPVYNVGLTPLYLMWGVTQDDEVILC